jgi:hypothetical protein
MVHDAFEENVQFRPHLGLVHYVYVVCVIVFVSLIGDFPELTD